MLEISVIRDYEVLVDYKKAEKEVKNYANNLKVVAPEVNTLKKMENKFIKLMNSDKQVKTLYAIATGAIIAGTNTTFAYANNLVHVSERIRVITSPIVELLAGLGYPITYGMLIVGALMIITGRKSKGLEVIKWACMGYIGLQFVPFLLGLLEMIGSELRNSL
ncbi:MAG: hypothetical protein ACRCUM_04210 [Mycoplasmoidaceae bacterium]